MAMARFHYVDLQDEADDRKINMPNRGQGSNVQDPAGKPGYVGPLPLDDSRSKHWRGKIGTFIAENHGFDITKVWHIADWPPGYTFWRHRRASGKQTYDWYLYGKGGKTRFASPEEFQYHALWLHDTEWNACGPCCCTKCTGRKQRDIEAEWRGITQRKPPRSGNPDQRAPVPLTPPLEDVYVDTKAKRLFLWTHLRTSLVAAFRHKNSAISQQRDHELSSPMSYRVGELVWVSIPCLQPDSSKPEERIDVWPALVSETKPGTAATSGTSRDAAPGAALRYSLYLLGVGSSVVVEQRRILPWQAFQLPRSVRTRIKSPPLPANLREDMLNLESFRPMRLRDFANSEAARTYETALAPMAIGHGVAVEMAKFCRVCEPYPDSTRAQKPRLYQGVWYGSERIWLHDMVRLRKSRTEIVGDSGRENKRRWTRPSRKNEVLFAQVSQIELPLEGDTDYKFTARLYQLAEDDAITFSESENDDEPLAQPEYLSYHTEAHAEPYALPIPPRGLRWRRIYKKATSLRFDLQDIAGRYHSPPNEADAGTSDLLKGFLGLRNVGVAGYVPTNDADTIRRVEHIFGLKNVEWLEPSPEIRDAEERQETFEKAQKAVTRRLYQQWNVRRREGEGSRHLSAGTQRGRNNDAMDEGW